MQKSHFMGNVWGKIVKKREKIVHYLACNLKLIYVKTLCKANIVILQCF